MVGGGGWYAINVARRIKALERASPYASRKRRRKRSGEGPERPAGPRLIRGRGLHRRRPNYARWLRTIACMAVAAAAAIFVATRWILPFLAPSF
jgi:hypothetical protein